MNINDEKITAKKIANGPQKSPVPTLVTLQMRNLRCKEIHWRAHGHNMSVAQLGGDSEFSVSWGDFCCLNQLQNSGLPHTSFLVFHSQNSSILFFQKMVFLEWLQITVFLHENIYEDANGKRFGSFGEFAQCL